MNEVVSGDYGVAQDALPRGKVVRIRVAQRSEYCGRDEQLGDGSGNVLLIGTYRGVARLQGIANVEHRDVIGQIAASEDPLETGLKLRVPRCRCREIEDGVRVLQTQDDVGGTEESARGKRQRTC